MIGVAPLVVVVIKAPRLALRIRTALEIVPEPESVSKVSLQYAVISTVPVR